MPRRRTIVSDCYSYSYDTREVEKLWLWTFLAIVSSVFLCSTCQTTPPLPAPNSLIFSKSSAFSSPTVCFCVKNCSRRTRCSESRSSSFNFLVSASQLVQPLSSLLPTQHHHYHSSYKCSHFTQTYTKWLYSTVALVPPISTMDVWRGIT